MKTRNGTSSRNSTEMERFWVGASDLGERGNFLWYNADRHVSDANWSEEGRPEEEVSRFRGTSPIIAKKNKILASSLNIALGVTIKALDVISSTIGIAGSEQFQ